MKPIRKSSEDYEFTVAANKTLTLRVQFYVVNARDRVRIPAHLEEMVHCRHTAVFHVGT